MAKKKTSFGLGKQMHLLYMNECPISSPHSLFFMWLLTANHYVALKRQLKWMGLIWFLILSEHLYICVVHGFVWILRTNLKKTCVQERFDYHYRLYSQQYWRDLCDHLLRRWIFTLAMSSRTYEENGYKKTVGFVSYLSSIVCIISYERRTVRNKYPFKAHKFTQCLLLPL
jgi:hypothetical protein